ncbi:MAG: hypothetical protein ACJ8ES_22325, partial [Xanthobacteraceae bacterium]
MERPVPDANRPRVEPEIIPPGQPDPRSRRGPAFDGHGTQRVYVARVGPFGFAMVALAVALVLALVFLLVLVTAGWGGCSPFVRSDIPAQCDAIGFEECKSQARWECANTE